MFTRVNVGEWTRLAMPNPRAMPLTSWVFPAPRSPVRPMIQPSCASRPQDSPRASVSAGLCEMCIAMSLQGPDTVLIADSEALAGGDLADATKRQAGVLLLPGIQQRHSVAAANGEQQFE